MGVSKVYGFALLERGTGGPEMRASACGEWWGTLLTARKSNHYPAIPSWAGPIQEKSLKGFFLQWA
ncbi:MAG: hypothetical protein SPL94_09255 [Oribacterium sp.]|nr:hypothetical protein [Oribacterium sp.]